MGGCEGRTVRLDVRRERPVVEMLLHLKPETKQDASDRQRVERFALCQVGWLEGVWRGGGNMRCTPP